jgi:hypothetical protein
MNSDIFYKKYLKYKAKYFNLKGGVDIKRDTYGWGKNNKRENITYDDLVVTTDIDYYIRTSKTDTEFSLVNLEEKKVVNGKYTYIFKDRLDNNKPIIIVKDIRRIAIVTDTIANRKRRERRDNPPPK